MSTAKMLAEAVQLARDAGYVIREDHLDGAGGGHCRIHDVKWLLLDVTQPLEEQLNDAVDALRQESLWRKRGVSPDLADLLGMSKAA